MTVGSFFIPSSSNDFFAVWCKRMSASCSARNFFEYPALRYAQWSSSINDRLKQTVVLDVVAGNFDGNDEGREQILCVTGLKVLLSVREL